MIFADIESIVFSRVKNSVNKKLKKKYPNLSFTTSNKIGANVKFPYCYIHLINSSETYMDTEGENVNAVSTTFQIEVNDLDSQDRAKEVSFEIAEVMKKMRFRLIGFPYADNTDSNFRIISRFRRTIGYDDIL